MTICVNVKSGTGGYYDYDGCDLCIKKIETNDFPVPRIGESLDIFELNDENERNSFGEFLKEYHQYLVTDVRYWINGDNYGITIYVVPIGRCVKQGGNV